MSVVYFVGPGSPNLVKIGVTGDFATRIAGLRANCPIPLLVHGVTAGDIKRERQLHVEFRHHRAHGEWFHLVEATRDFIRTETVSWQEVAEFEKPKQKPATKTITVACGSEFGDRAYILAESMGIRLSTLASDSLRELAIDLDWQSPPDHPEPESIRSTPRSSPVRSSDDHSGYIW